MCQPERHGKRPSSGSDMTPAKDTATRQRVVALLAQCFSKADLGTTQPRSPERVATGIEEALHSICGNKVLDEYRQRARMLRSNLAHPQNATLRGNVLSGALSPEELCRLDSQDLAPEALRQQRETFAREGLREAWDQEGPLPATPYEGLDSTCSSYRNAGAPPPPPRRRRLTAQGREPVNEGEESG
mmetsp:Transcript_136010/g.302900  ORF Transcript_136010/g.302900 Transcript_136010/m.302900 type:complete len:187 (-) Transcript_136010:27-587(-)